jgi:hypothetical protein
MIVRSSTELTLITISSMYIIRNKWLTTITPDEVEVDVGAVDINQISIK